MKSLRHPEASPSAAALAHRRSVSTARRLLSGLGRLEVVAYDLDPSASSTTLHHFLDGAGRLVVIGGHDASDPVHRASAQTPTRVRVDIVKEAPEARVRITACTLHALGTLTWLDEARAATSLAKACPWANAVVAMVPGARVGVIEFTDLHLHTASGTSCLSVSEVISEPGSVFPAANDEWSAREVIDAFTDGSLEGLFDHPAAEVVTQRRSVGCASTVNRTFCVDIDARGLTLMRVGSDHISVAVLPFANAAETIDGFVRSVGDLVIAPWRSFLA